MACIKYKNHKVIQFIAILDLQMRLVEAAKTYSNSMTLFEGTKDQDCKKYKIGLFDQG